MVVASPKSSTASASSARSFVLSASMANGSTSKPVGPSSAPAATNATADVIDQASSRRATAA
jgi:hypothetical protein